MDKEKLILKYLNGDISDDELQRLKENGDLEFINKLDEHLVSFKATGFDVDSSYQNIKNQLRSRKEEKIKTLTINPIFYRIAAVLVLALSIGIVVSNYFAVNSVKTVAYEQQQEILLPDSSFVRLNKGSEIRFDEEKFLSEREIKLTGEALFTVKKGTSFQVISESGKVTVLGTVFNVRNLGSLFEVACYKGSVKVENDKEEVVLVANEKVSALEDLQLNVSDINNISQPSWMDGKSVFESVPFYLVLEEFELQYDVSVEIRDKSFDRDKLFTGSFSHDNIKLALQSITIPFDLSFKLAGKEVILNSDRQ